MKLAIDENLTIEFDPYYLHEAVKLINEIESRMNNDPHGCERILNALFTVLLFYQIEVNMPGFILKTQEALDACFKMKSKATNAG